MAKRNLTSFGPGDVLEVVIRCRNCGSGISIAIWQAQATGPGVSHCPGCLSDWDTFRQHQEDLGEIRKLLDALRHFSQEQDPWTVEMVIEDRPGGTVQDAP